LLAGLLATATLLAALAAALRLLAGFFTRVHTNSFVGPPTQNEIRALPVPLILRSEACAPAWTRGLTSVTFAGGVACDDESPRHA
jgi:hypothetical protein